ncbi:diaminopimelate decarboxylase, partial [Weissella cibaria]|nr:diaminopimelate decarboxylase [Weissella cibaria]
MQTPYQTNAAGHLSIGGVDANELAQRFGTPLYAYDVGAMRQQMRDFKRVFEERHLNYAVSYASKAFATIAMYEVAAQEGMHIDVVSGGEIYTALRAKFPMADVSFNGNNKSVEELTMAIENGLGTIIVDNFYELQVLHELLAERQQTQDILLRITPGVEAHTHDYISTGQTDSKFGFDVNSGQAEAALQQALADPNLNVLGVHAHIGSQIFDVTGFQMAAAKLVDLVHEWDFEPQVINAGGGFGIRYTADDEPLPAATFVEAIIDTIAEKAAAYGM